MKKYVFLGILSFSAILNPAKTQDRHFAWTYESITLPKGSFDFEPSFIYSAGKENFYNRLFTALEFETGLTDHLQTAFYFNAVKSMAAVADSNNLITGLSSSSSISISNEWKLNILNPSSSPVGFGLYGEYTLSAEEIEIEYKLLLDKKMEKDLISYNLVGEHGFEFIFENDGSGKGEIETEKEIKLENDLSYMHMFKPTLGLGIEIRNHNIIEKGELEFAPVFAGPTLFFSTSGETGNDFFFIINALPQLTNIAGERVGKLDLEDHEKIEARVCLGFTF